ncbi:MAG TPA: DUF6036 family nucleotidyltransferase [Tepidisphaeraceae bacterium]|jgi:hypothetical protein|nr:DUF6036 family nucleotidyltransferase [Tepidisphaeraceae bacterium]
MTQAVDELWAVARGGAGVDAGELAAAIEETVGSGEVLDYRTRLLVRDALAALEGYWGEEKFSAWRNRMAISALDQEGDEEGFPSLGRRLMDAVTPEVVLEFLRELSLHVSRRTVVVVGGSIALILRGYLSRHTDDVDLVDEVPGEIRGQHELLERLTKRYGLRLAHFQSHYLNEGWDKRLRSAGVFGNLSVLVVDVYDVFVGKLFSVREKDRDDLRMLKQRLDREKIVQRLQETAGKLREEPRMVLAAEENWFVLFGEKLPG